MPTHWSEFQQPIGEPIPDWMPPEFPGNHPLVGRDCLLDPLNSEAHAKGLYQAFADDRDWTYLPYGPFTSFVEFRGWLDSMSGGSDPKFYAIRLAETGFPVGIASYLRMDPDNGSIEVGHIHFSESLKQSIAATEAMYLMMKEAFELGYRRYEWKCDALNAASRSAAARLGLSFEGIFRSHTVYKGRNRDTAWFAATDSDWPALKTAFTRWLHPDNFGHDGRQVVSLSSLTRPILNNFTHFESR